MPTRDEESPDSTADFELTSVHLRRAGEGDAASRDWVVTRFSPFLMLQARYRLRGRLVGICLAEDLVDEVWLTVLPRLGDLRPRDDHLKPVFLKFLGTTLLNHLNNHLTRHLRREGHRTRLADPSSGGIEPLDRIAARASGVVTQAQRHEADAILHEALEGLDARDQEILVLRGIEQLPNHEVCATLDLAPSAVAMRYRRALDRLKMRLPPSLFETLPEA